MLQGLTAYVEGRIRTQEWSPTDSLLHRRLNALQALTRHGQQPTRAAAALDIDPLRLPTAALIDWVQIVRRLPGLPQREQSWPPPSRNCAIASAMPAAGWSSPASARTIGGG